MTNQTLKDVLNRINEAVTDFINNPARTANNRGAYDDYPLHKVAIWGDIPAATMLLAHGAEINALGENDDTPLHRAVAGGHIDMVRLLLDRGANPHLKNIYGNTPLADAEKEWPDQFKQQR